MKIDPYNDIHQATDDFNRAIMNDNALITSFGEEIEHAGYAQTEEKSEAYRREGVEALGRRYGNVQKRKK